MSQRSIYIAASTFAVGVMLGLFWPDSPAVTSDAVEPQEPSMDPGAFAAGRNEESLSGESVDESNADFAERLRKATEIRNGLKRSRAISAIADGLDVRQVRKAVEAIERIHIPECDAIRLQLLSRWAEL
jgi:hypothetical protein